MDSLVRPNPLMVRHELGNKSGNIRFTASIFGSKDENLSLAGLYGPQDVLKRRGFCDALKYELTGLGARRVFAPTPVDPEGKFKAILIPPHELTTKIPLGHGLNLWRNRAKPADGTLLQQVGDTGIISAGGCPTIVATYRDKCIFAHAGRDCLIDRKWIDSRFTQRGRQHGSVVDSIIQTLKTSEPFEADDVEVWVFWAIKPENFYDNLDDPKWGKRNRETFNYVQGRFGKAAYEQDGRLIGYDLPVMIGALFAQHGVLNIYDDHAYLPDEFPTTRTKGQERMRYLSAFVRQL
ncbi:MAG TPA: hypothetical protein VG984_00640 [Candidatus Paceibacterota bacterium]|nr:hypothetical protein [Candidatus Paceibacterota bacterium]